jgi:hypothetical protein
MDGHSNNMMRFASMMPTFHLHAITCKARNLSAITAASTLRHPDKGARPSRPHECPPCTRKPQVDFNCVCRSLTPQHHALQLSAVLRSTWIMLQVDYTLAHACFVEDQLNYAIQIWRGHLTSACALAILLMIKHKV